VQHDARALTDEEGHYPEVRLSVESRRGPSPPELHEVEASAEA